MSLDLEYLEKSTQMVSPDFTPLGAQLNEVLGKFNKLSTEMVEHRRVIDQLVANNNVEVPNNQRL